MQRVIRGPAALLLCVSLCLALGAACAPSDPPPTSPLDDSSAPQGPAGTDVPLPTFPPTETPGASAGAPIDPPAQDEERVIGGAIDALAEWLGVAATRITYDSIQAREWDSACMGVQVPGTVCAEVVTPGYLVRLSVEGSEQAVHASGTGNYVWAPGFWSERVIESVDASSGSVVLAPLDGSDEMGTRHRVVPGSYLEAPLADLRPGTRVHIAVSYALPGQDQAPIVWLVPVEE